jgi:hypothetical protein
MVNRRKFLIGLGAVSTGSAAAFGTAASTTFNLNDRKVGANITTDSAGAVALTDQGNAGDIINETGGELEIDFAQGRASGVNVGSVVSVGGANPNNPGASAFTITNQTTAPIELTIQFEAGSNYSANSNGSELIFRFDNTNFSVDGNNRPKYIGVTADSGWNPSSGYSEFVTNFDSSGDTGSVSYDAPFGGDDQSIPAGGTVLAAITVNADEPQSNPSENLSGVLNLTATQV